jgi:hypothetical protein
MRYSALRERLKGDDAADLAKLTPAQRLQAALDLSDFCLMLAAKVREADAQQLGVRRTAPRGLAHRERTEQPRPRQASENQSVRKFVFVEQL